MDNLKAKLTVTGTNMRVRRQTEEDAWQTAEIRHSQTPGYICVRLAPDSSSRGHDVLTVSDFHPASDPNTDGRR